MVQLPPHVYLLIPGPTPREDGIAQQNENSKGEAASNIGAQRSTPVVPVGLKTPGQSNQTTNDGTRSPAVRDDKGQQSTSVVPADADIPGQSTQTVITNDSQPHYCVL